MLGSVGLRGTKFRGDYIGLVERLTALLAKLCAGAIRLTATGTRSFKPRSAFLTEGRVSGILVLAPGTLHTVASTSRR